MFFFFKQNTAYEMRISDWSSDVCSSDLHVDPGADIARIRKKVEESAASNPRWDKRVAILQVTEHRPEALELRALLSASNAGLAFDLRCAVREAVMNFLRDAMPEAIGRASCRERVWQSVSISVVAVSVQKKS